MTRADFEHSSKRAAAAHGTRSGTATNTVVSVGVDSSSIAKGADEVLAACRVALRGTNAIVRKSAATAPIWMEPTVEIKRPGEPPVVYGWIRAG